MGIRKDVLNKIQKLYDLTHEKYDRANYAIFSFNLAQTITPKFQEAYKSKIVTNAADVCNDNYYWDFTSNYIDTLIDEYTKNPVIMSEKDTVFLDNLIRSPEAAELGVEYIKYMNTAEMNVIDNVPPYMWIDIHPNKVKTAIDTSFEGLKGLFKTTLPEMVEVMDGKDIVSLTYYKEFLMVEENDKIVPGYIEVLYRYDRKTLTYLGAMISKEINKTTNVSKEIHDKIIDTLS